MSTQFHPNRNVIRWQQSAVFYTGESEWTCSPVLLCKHASDLFS